MKITSAVRLDSAGAFLAEEKPFHVTVRCGADGLVCAVAWKYGSDDRMYSLAKRRGGVWKSDAGGWTFPDDPAAAQALFETVVEKHPDWLVIGQPSQSQQFLAGVRISRVPLPDGHEACLVPLPLPHFAEAAAPDGVRCFELIGEYPDQKVGLLVGRADQVAEFVERVRQQGAVADDSLAVECGISTAASTLQVKVNGWAVEIACDLDNPLHCLVAPPRKEKWVGRYVAVPWDGVIHTTRKLWVGWKEKIERAGLSWEGDDPELEPVLPAAFHESLVPGWRTSAPNGHLLHQYQKEGAQFCARRGMRALVGDEMGVGKTAQAIAAAEAAGAGKVIVICPANARYVWDREIKGWGSGGAIQHIAGQLDTLDEAARWHIATYDQLVARAETWRLQNELEERAFLHVFPDRKKHIASGKYPRKISLDAPSDLAPAFTDPKRLVAWQNMMRRLKSELLVQIIAAGHAGQILVILDEAHRVKNRDAKRTQAIRKITEGKAHVLLLTGTPLRNNEHEAAVLLGFLDAEANSTLTKEKGYTIQDVKDYLGHYMIRRTKAEVLPELPPKTRQQIDLDQLDGGSLDDYRAALDFAREMYCKALKAGKSEAEARQKMLGGIEMARTALGLSAPIQY